MFLRRELLLRSLVLIQKVTKKIKPKKSFNPPCPFLTLVRLHPEPAKRAFPPYTRPAFLAGLCPHQTTVLRHPGFYRGTPAGHSQRRRGRLVVEKSFFKHHSEIDISTSEIDQHSTIFPFLHKSEIEHSKSEIIPLTLQKNPPFDCPFKKTALVPA